MSETVTFNADGAAVEKARARAQAEKTTLGEKLRRWVEDYAASDDAQAEARLARHRETMEKLKHVSTGGRTFTRDEMNER